MLYFQSCKKFDIYLTVVISGILFSAEKASPYQFRLLFSWKTWTTSFFGQNNASRISEMRVLSVFNLELHIWMESASCVKRMNNIQ